MFRIVNNRGFQMTFENKLIISVMFGAGNYCQNKTENWDAKIEKSTSAEIAIWEEDGECINFGCDTVIGWASSDDVAKFVSMTAKAKNFKELQKKIKKLND